jgi:hypothetical protein
MNSCRDCTERHIGCHSECEKYKAYCAERAELKAKIAKSNQYDNYAKDIHATRRDRTAKHRRSTAGLSRFGG